MEQGNWEASIGWPGCGKDPQREHATHTPAHGFWEGPHSQKGLKNIEISAYDDMGKRGFVVYFSFTYGCRYVKATVILMLLCNGS